MRRLLAAAGLAVLAGCAGAPAPACARLAWNGWFCPLPPAALAPRSGTDLVTVTRGGRSRHYVGQLSITRTRLTLALSNLAGVPLATVSWDGREARVEPARSRLEPKRMTALLELTLAPPQALRGALHGITLSERSLPGGRERRLHAGGTLVARAVTANGATRIEVPRADLVVQLKPLGDSAE